MYTPEGEQSKPNEGDMPSRRGKSYHLVFVSHRETATSPLRNSIPRLSLRLLCFLTACHSHDALNAWIEHRPYTRLAQRMFDEVLKEVFVILNKDERGINGIIRNGEVVRVF